MWHIEVKEQLMSIREMATTLGINPNTVKKAYSELENRGVIVTISTKGTFISENITQVVDLKVDEILEQIRNNIMELEKLGVSKEEILKRI